MACLRVQRPESAADLSQVVSQDGASAGRDEGEQSHADERHAGAEELAVALITPEELKALAEDTGLPPRVLGRVSS